MRHSSLLLTILSSWLSLFGAAGPNNSAQCADQQIIQFDDAQSNFGTNPNVSVYLPALGGPREIGAWLSDSLAIHILNQLRTSSMSVRIIRDAVPIGVMGDSEAVRLASERSAESDFIIWGKTYSIDDDLII
jgi:hypothetical protein